METVARLERERARALSMYRFAERVFVSLFVFGMFAVAVVLPLIVR